MKQKFISSLVSSVMVAVLLIVSTSASRVRAEEATATAEASSGSSPSSSPVPAPIPVPVSQPLDLSPLANHATIVASMFKKVAGVRISVNAGSGTENYDNSRFYPFTNEVKTISAIMAVIGNDWWSSQVTSNADYISITVRFYDSSDYNTVYNGGANVLFEGYGGGQPVQGQYGVWTLPSYATEISMNVAQTYYLAVPGVVDARLIRRDQWGNPSGVPLFVNDGLVGFPTDNAGNGELVLTTYTLSPNGYYVWTRKAYNISTGVEIQLTWVQWQILLRDSEDFVSLKNPDSIDKYVYSYQGYGKVPLLIVESTVTKTNLLLSVRTDQAHATSFELEEQSTKVKSTNSVPDGATGVKIKLPAGTWYIVPKGLQLQPWNTYGGGGGKG